MENDLKSAIHRASTWSIVLSVLIMALGVLAIALPMIAGFAVTALVGWLLILSGILHLALAWRGGRPAAVIWEILLGAIYGTAGLYILANPVIGLASLTAVVAFYLFVEGVLETILSFQLRPAPGAWWLLVDGIVTLALAILIWVTWPASAAWILGTIVGVSMLFSGITRLMFSQAVRRLSVGVA